MLCLNGCELDLSEYTITVPKNSSLTICDCQGTGRMTGGEPIKVSGGSLTLYAGTITQSTDYGVQVSSSGTFTMNGGTISNNAGYGVYVSGSFTNPSGTMFIMNDGEITGNTYTHGGGVYVSDGTFTMNGGKITGNTGTYSVSGGGVYVNSGSFTMTGGEITGNTAGSGGGGGVYLKEGTFTVSGNAKVQDNKQSDTTTDSNVYLPAKSTITIGEDRLSGDAQIGVTMATPGTFVNGNGTGQGQYFFSDNTDYSVLETADGQLKIGQAYTVQFVLGDADGTVFATQTVAPDAAAQQPADPTWNGYVFVGWYSNDVQWNFQNPVSGNMTLTAKWRFATPDAVATPSDEDITSDSITVPTDADKEYAVVPSGTVPNEEDWVKGDGSTHTFDNLNPDAAYDILVRVPTDGNTLASDPAKTTVTTDSDGTTQPEKPEPPAAVVTPPDEDITSDSITIPTDSDKEYAVVPKGETPEEQDWKPGTGGDLTFDGLEPDTEYDILVRVPADEDTPASDPAKTTVTTDSDGTTQPEKPEPPAAVVTPPDEDITSDSITIPTDSDKEYAVVPKDETPEEQDWKPGTGGDLTFDGLEPDTEYDILVRVPADEDTPASDPAKTTVTTDSDETTQPEKPEPPAAVVTPPDEDITSDSITIPTDSDKEYAVVPKGETPGEQDWKPGTGGDLLFDGLEPDTEYDILVRVPADEDTPASDPAKTTVTTDSDGTTQPEKPEPPAAVVTPPDEDITSDSITIPTDSDKEYAVVPKDETPEEQDWKPGTGGDLTFDGLEPDTEYDILVRYPSKGEEPASDPSKTTVTTDAKEITVTWSGLHQTYGDGTVVSAVLSGVEPSDAVAANITIRNDSVDEQYDKDKPYAAGNYVLSVTLTGSDADKYDDYTLQNSTATLVIRKKPVIITVTDNVTTTDNITLPTIQVPSYWTEDDYHVFYKDKDENKVVNPSAPGIYEVWVEITNPNYSYSDGSSDKEIGSFTITEMAPVLHTITFAGSNVDEMEATAGSLLILPDCTQEKEGYQFVGWTYDGKTYQPGDYFTMPDGDVTFTARWEQTYEVTVTVEEQTDSGTVPVKHATVSLWQGANKLSEVTTGVDGTYTFTDLVPGIYNLVVTKGERTVTSKVEITTESLNCTATLPKGVINSIVEVTPGSPDIVVGNLDHSFTADDMDMAERGGKVEFVFTADEKQKGDQTISSDMEKIAQTKDDAVTVGLVMDYAITKSVTDPHGTTTTTDITQSNVLLEILLPLPVEMQGKADYAVYRVHSSTGQEQDKQAQELTKTPNALGEYFTVSSDKTSLTLYVKCFSTYAVGYSETPLTPDDGDKPTGGGSSGGGSSTPTYSPSVEQPDHGTVTVSPNNPQKGDSVTITAKPEDGYTVDTVTVTDAKGETVVVTPNGNGTYTFVQPAGNVTITVTFRQQNHVSDCLRDESCPMAPFTDTDRSAWYHDGVHYCVEQGLMVGTSDTTFVPSGATTRGMVVTILWRLAGSPTVDAPLEYRDVAADAWYSEAVRWADSAGVVTGYGNGEFRPNNPITREQMATMLWRYAQYQKLDVSVGENTNILSYIDAPAISEYAVPAMQWACGTGLIQGVGGGRLHPTGTATRAQVACIFQRFNQQ